MTDPETLADWQVAVDAADALLALESARAYGLVTGGPTVNIKRAEQLILRGRQHGIRPSPDSVERLLKELRS